MVNQNMAVANGRNPDYVGSATPTGAADGDHNAYDNPSELGAFVSPDELEEFLRTFQEGGEDEAQVDTQGTDDIGGEPTTTVH